MKGAFQRSARSGIRTAWMLAAVAVFAAGAVTLALSLAGADGTPPDEVGKTYQPGVAATPTATIAQSNLVPLDDALANAGAGTAVMAIDQAMGTADWEAVAAAWQRATVDCFKGSSRTGGLCADLPGEPGAAIPVEVVTISINGPVPAGRALAWLRDLLDGNPATLSFVARDKAAGRLYAAYAIAPRVHPWSSDGDFVVGYLWFELDPSAEAPIVAIDPIATAGDPLAYWREAGEPGDLVALDPALEAAEKARDTAFATQVAQVTGPSTATASVGGGR